MELIDAACNFRVYTDLRGRYNAARQNSREPKLGTAFGTQGNWPNGLHRK
jgi:hypothetical protein